MASDAKAPEISPAAAEAPAAAAPAPASATSAAAASLDKVKDVAANAKESLQNFTATNSGSVLALVVAGIAITFVTAAALYWIINRNLVNTASYLLVESKIPRLATQVSKCVGSPIPASGNGRRQSICFWVYINDINEYSGSYRHVFHRGNSSDDFTKAGPYVRLDKDTNSITVTYAVTASETPLVTNFTGYSTSDGGSPVPDSAADPKNNEEKWKFMKQAHGITFDYIPLQRWVHLAVVVNEDMNGGTMTTYIDGELTKTVSPNLVTNPSLNQAGNNQATAVTVTGDTLVYPIFDISHINLDQAGDVYVGGSTSSPIGPGFSGLVSRITFFNYDISAQDVYANYRLGPIDNLLARMGLPAYGVQSPVYRIA